MYVLRQHSLIKFYDEMKNDYPFSIVYLFYIFVFNMSIDCCATQTKTIHKSTAIFKQFITTTKITQLLSETTHGNKTHTQTRTHLQLGHSTENR